MFDEGNPKSLLMSKPILMPKEGRAPEHPVSLTDIQAAMGRIRDSIYLSPCARSEAFFAAHRKLRLSEAR